MAACKEIVLNTKGIQEQWASFNLIRKERDSAKPELLEKILGRDNLNRAFKRLKGNKGAAGFDGRLSTKHILALRRTRRNS